jgi:hypothetical protein
MPINQYVIGQRVRLSGRCEVLDTGELVSPSVVVRTYSPSGVADTVDETELATGVFRAEFVPDEEGTWQYRFEGTGAAEAAGEGSFQVLPSVFEP